MTGSENTSTSRPAKVSFLKNAVIRDHRSVDFQLSLLFAAVNSYRHDSVLKPFPPMFCTTEERNVTSPTNKDHEKLKQHVAELLSVKQLAAESFLTGCSEKLLDLVYWTLNAKSYQLESCSLDKLTLVQSLTGHITEVPPPNHIFEVRYSETAEGKFRAKQGDKPLIYAYHGSRIENFHSILYYGLQSHMNKNSFFGEGTYCSSELAVSMPYAPCGQTWKHSCLGDKLGCVAVCEIIDDASVKCQTKNTENASQRGRARAPNSMGGDVPEKYYVVRNNEVIRVKYLLVYVDAGVRKTSHQLSWLQRHKFAVMICLYILLLVFIGAYNSKLGQTFLRKWKR